MIGTVRQVSSTATPAQVAELAARVAADAAADPRTRLIALRALRGHWTGPSAGNDARAAGRATVAALGNWARSVRLVREPASIGEVIAAPWRTAAYQAGDCDDLATAIAAFAAVFGLPSAITVYPTAHGFAHAAALIGDDWTPTGRGRLTHHIDHDGAKLAPSDLQQRAIIVPVSAGG